MVFRLSPMFRPTLPAFIRVNGHYKHHTPLITTTQDRPYLYDQQRALSGL